MKDDKIGREPQFFGEMEDNRIFWQKKTTSISREMKDDLKMEDDPTEK